MKAWPSLLRVIVSIALVLNAIGGAAAGTRMDVDQVPAMERASHDAVDTGKPCHEPQTAVPDCCKSGACTCACAHLAAVALPSLQQTALVPNRNLAVQRLQMSHASPALPHLIRPPID